MEIECYYSEIYEGYLKIVFHDWYNNPTLEDDEVVYEVCCDWGIPGTGEYAPWDCFTSRSQAYEYFESVKENI